MASERRVVVDSCVLINVFTGGTRDDPAWLPDSQKVLRHAEAGDYRLVASALTLAEVAGSGKVRGTDVPGKDRRKSVARVREWLQDHQRWLLVELDDRLAGMAAELAITHQLKGGDAVILASALAAKAESLVSWDQDLLKLRGIAGLELSICTPAELVIEQEDLMDM